MVRWPAVALLAGAVVASACASSPDWHWETPPEKSEADLAADRSACDVVYFQGVSAANGAPNGYARGFLLGSAARAKRDCLIGRGWNQVPNK